MYRVVATCFYAFTLRRDRIESRQMHAHENSMYEINWQQWHGNYNARYAIGMLSSLRWKKQVNFADLRKIEICVDAFITILCRFLRLFALNIVAYTVAQ